MRNLKLLVLSATFVVATAGLALAGDCDKSASASAAKAKSDCSSTASAQTAAVKTAGTEGGCASSASAVKTAGTEGGCDKSASAVKTASAEGGCDKSASAVKTAGAEGGCDKSASAVKTASAEGGCASSASAVKTAGADAGCATKATTAGAVKVETVRMPSGALAVFYNGTSPESVSFLQASADKDCSDFVCPLAKGMATDENCKVEMAKTEHGVMMLVTSAKAEILDGYAAQYAAVTAPAEAGAEE